MNKRVKRTLIVLVSILIPIISLIILSVCKWDIWFSNPPEPPYQSPNHPTRVLLTYSAKGADSRAITWCYGETDIKGEVELINKTQNDTSIIEAKSQIFKSRAGVSTYYNATVDSVIPSSSYKYRVMHPNDTSDWYNFNVQSKNDTLKMVFIGDVQDTINGISGTLFHQIAELNRDIDLYLFGGDVIERPMAQYWDYWFSTVDSIAQSTPIVAAAGNHEYLKDLPGELEARFFLTFPYFNITGSQDNALAALNIENTEILILDSNREFWRYPAQSIWLNRELEDSKASWKIVTLHHPIYSVKSSINNIMQRISFNPIIKSRGVDLVLQGHEHAFLRLIPEGKAKPVYITSHASPKNYRVDNTWGAQKIGRTGRYYQIITATPNNLTIETFNSNHELYDFVELEK